jgi:hypothetical protein
MVLAALPFDAIRFLCSLLELGSLDVTGLSNNMWDALSPQRVAATRYLVPLLVAALADDERGPTRDTQHHRSRCDKSQERHTSAQWCEACNKLQKVGGGCYSKRNGLGAPG